MSIEVRTRKEYTIRKEYPIEMIDLVDLIPHEQCIPHELDKFIKGVQETKTLYWPLLIDAQTNLILDGHHRTAGLKKLKYKNIPAVKINYLDDKMIQIDTWYPIIKIDINKVINNIKELDTKITKIDSNDFDLQSLKERKFTVVIYDSIDMYQVIGDREEIYQIIRDNWLQDIIYYDDPLICLDKANREHTAVISWSYTKDEILDLTLGDKIMLPKTTRHTLTYEVMKCNISLDKLEKLL